MLQDVRPPPPPGTTPSAPGDVALDGVMAFLLGDRGDAATHERLRFLVLRRPGWRPLVNFLRRVDVDTWDYLVSHGDDLSDDTELSLYVVGR